MNKSLSSLENIPEIKDCAVLAQFYLDKDNNIIPIINTKFLSDTKGLEVFKEYLRKWIEIKRQYE